MTGEPIAAKHTRASAHNKGERGGARRCRRPGNTFGYMVWKTVRLPSTPATGAVPFQ